VPPPNALPEQPTEEEGVEALTKGPIHEAFADPATPDPEPSPVVGKAPPADVPEQPAAYKPEGNFVWIPGNWSWDDDRDDFVWVTGVWRQPPPGMRWVSGYWQEINGGWQRVKGFWIQEQTQEVAYYNQPPATLEAGPSSPAPAANYFWIPGSWTYANTGFNWQAGYWAPYQQDWVYVPARWIWTPAGFVYVAGYWDYRLGARGQIFAPVYFQRPVYAQAGWFYRPSIAIPTSNLFIHLWIQPRYGSYFFGNYFGPQYMNRGFVAWSNLPSHRHGYYYDPFYSYAHVHYRQQGVDYLGRVQGWHNYYAQHPEHRPPATFHEQREWLKTPAAAAVGRDAQLVARPIGEIARQGDSPIKFTHLNEHALQTQAEHAKQIRELDAQRKNLERQHAHVNFNRPADGADQVRDRGKTGPLVDRIDKSGKVDKGRDLPPGKTGGETVKAEQTAKLSLPKVDLPKSAVTPPRVPAAGELPKAGERVNVSPLPRGDGSPRVNINPRGAVDRQNTTVLPQNPLPDAGKSSRSTFGAKTGESSPLPGRVNEPRLPSRETTNREVKTKDGGNRVGGDNGNKGRSGNESSVRGGDSIPGLPPGMRVDGAKVQSSERSIAPGVNQPGITPSNVPSGKSPTFKPRESSNPQTIVPPIGSRDRGNPRNDQSTFQKFGSKPGGGNVNPPQPQPQPQRGPTGQEGGGTTNENSKKGKSRNEK